MKNKIQNIREMWKAKMGIERQSSKERKPEVIPDLLIDKDIAEEIRRQEKEEIIWKTLTKK